MNLTAENVDNAFRASLFQEPIPESAVDIAKIASGVMLNVGFDPALLEMQRENVRLMLAELPDDFQATGGGGMSFLNMCMRKDGEQWTGMHQTQDQLLTLGLALGLVAYLAPRELWPALPGSMPYVVVTL